jgi:prophage regulatory protein
VAELHTILRMPQVEAATGLKASHLYALIARGEFPRGVKLLSQAVGWYTDEIAGWLDTRERAMGGCSPRTRKSRAPDEAA